MTVIPQYDVKIKGLSPLITVNTVAISHLVRGGGAGLQQDSNDLRQGRLGGGGEVQRRVALQVHGVDSRAVVHQ